MKTTRSKCSFSCVAATCATTCLTLPMVSVADGHTQQAWLAQWEQFAKMEAEAQQEWYEQQKNAQVSMQLAKIESQRAQLAAQQKSQRVAQKQSTAPQRFQTLLSIQPGANSLSFAKGQSAGFVDLYVPEDFDFSASWTLALDIDASAYVAEETYLLICTSFEQADSGYEVDYGACQLSAPLVQGAYQGEVTMIDAVEEVLAVVLPLADPDSPVFFSLRPQTEGPRFVVN